MSTVPAGNAAFITGLYGMNFHTDTSPYNMPELSWKYGYFFALAVMAATEFDLVVCDMRMPDIDGPGLYRTAVAQLPYYANRFFFVTGDVLSPEVAQFLAQTGAPHIEKPFQRGEILRVAAEILARS